MNEKEAILFCLSDGDLTKSKQLEELSYKEIYKHYYLNKIKSLNSMYDTIAHIKNMRK